MEGVCGNAEIRETSFVAYVARVGPPSNELHHHQWRHLPTAKHPDVTNTAIVFS